MSPDWRSFLTASFTSCSPRLRSAAFWMMVTSDTPERGSELSWIICLTSEMRFLSLRVVPVMSLSTSMFPSSEAILLR